MGEYIKENMAVSNKKQNKNKNYIRQTYTLKKGKRLAKTDDIKQNQME